MRDSIFRLAKAFLEARRTEATLYPSTAELAAETALTHAKIGIIDNGIWVFDEESADAAGAEVIVPDGVIAPNPGRWLKFPYG
jgi:hypothetical protein